MVRRALALLLLVLCLAGANAEDPHPDHFVEPVNVTASNDLNATGPCKDAIAKLCPAVRHGDGRAARCIREKVKLASQRKEPPPTTLACQQSMSSFFRQVASSRVHAYSERVVAVEMVEGFRLACKADLQIYCSDVKPREAVVCLKEHKSKLSEGCQDKVFKIQQHEAADIGLDPSALAACQPDINNYGECNVTTPPGAQNACLRKYRKDLSENCRKQLFRREVETSGDIRLNLNVLNACRPEISSMCKDEEFGEARILHCLWEKSITKSIDGFSEDCKQKVQRLTARTVSDYRLDFKVRTTCETDIDNLCFEEKQAVDNMSIAELFGGDGDMGFFFQGKSGMVLRCLKANTTNIKTPACKQAVLGIVKMQASHWTSDPILKRHCTWDVDELCPNTVVTKVHQCLRKNIRSISQKCKEAELLQGQLEASDIALKPLIRKSCRTPIGQFCSSVTRGDARVLHCLQDNMYKETFPVHCRRELEDDLEASNHDWRLKFGVHEQCETDADRLCTGARTSTARSPVLTCLRSHVEDIKAPGCQNEMRRHIKAGIANIKLAPVLFDKCTEDVTSFCKNVTPGGGAVHDCLLKHRHEISQPCAAAEFEIQALRASDIRLSERVSQACAVAIKTVCRDVQAGEGRMWSCLEDNKDSDEMSTRCRHYVEREMLLKHSEFHLNLRLVKHCSADAVALCPGRLATATFKDFSSDGEVITCLAEQRAHINNTDCKSRVERKIVQRVENTELDPLAKDACSEDVKTHCSEELHAKAPLKVQRCLRKHWKDLSDWCKAKQKTYMVMASSDIRLNRIDAKLCKHAQKRFCGNVSPGKGKQMQCLLTHMHSTEMDATCRAVLVKEQKKRTSSIDFNPIIQKDCDGDLQTLKAKHKCAKTSGEGWALTCLVDNAKNLTKPGCLAAVKNLQKRQSADLRATTGAMEACGADAKKLCPGVSAGEARLKSCLEQKVDEIRSPGCKNIVSKLHKVDKTHATLNFDVMKHCANEAAAFCKDVHAGDSRKLACLGFYMREAGFSAGCKSALGLTNVESVKMTMPTVEGELKKALAAQKDNVRGFLDRWGAVLLMGTVGFVSVVAFGVSYYILHQKFFTAAYSVVVPKEDAEEG